MFVSLSSGKHTWNSVCKWCLCFSPSHRHHLYPNTSVSSISFSIFIECSYCKFFLDRKPRKNRASNFPKITEDLRQQIFVFPSFFTTGQPYLPQMKPINFWHSWACRSPHFIFSIFILHIYLLITRWQLKEWKVVAAGSFIHLRHLCKA